MYGESREFSSKCSFAALCSAFTVIWRRGISWLPRITCWKSPTLDWLATSWTTTTTRKLPTSVPFVSSLLRWLSYFSSNHRYPLLLSILWCNVTADKPPGWRSKDHWFCELHCVTVLGKLVTHLCLVPVAPDGPWGPWTNLVWWPFPSPPSVPDPPISPLLSTLPRHVSILSSCLCEAENFCEVFLRSQITIHYF